MDLYRQLADCIKLMDASSITYLRIKSDDFEFTLSKSGSGGEVADGADADSSTTTRPAPTDSATTSHAEPRDASTGGPADVPASVRGHAAAAADDDAVDPGLVVVRAPLLGTFYCAPEPGADAFVRVGDHVTAGATIGLLEAMKMFTAVPAGVDGTIERVVVADGDLVEYDQPIVLIRTN